MKCCIQLYVNFSVYGLILSITFDTEGGFIAPWNFLIFQSRHFLGLLRKLLEKFSCLLLMFAETSSSAYRSVASLVDALLPSHAIFPPKREESKSVNRSRAF